MSQRRLHFVGIAGVGMAPIAELALARGYRVSGSDLRDSPVTAQLGTDGAHIKQGHAARHLPAQLDALVRSTAVPDDNPEVAAARERGVPILRRAQMLAELMEGRRGVAVAGTHGKTTTSALIATVLAEAGLDPSAVVGGRVAAFGSGARAGAGDLMVVEADESDGSFLDLSPSVCVVTNVEREHMDHYGGEAELDAAFLTFVNRLPHDGLAVLCCDCPRINAMLDSVERRFVTYGLEEGAYYSARDIRTDGLSTSFELVRGGVAWDRVSVRLIGEHGVLNALATIAVCDELGVSPDISALALSRFSGVGRRFEKIGEAHGTLFFDDYAHHPTELRATLGAARRAYPEHRIIALFQPHRYSRTADLLDDFAAAFGDVDALRITEIYAAGEAPIEGVSGAILAEAAKAAGHRNVRFTGGLDETIDGVAGELRRDDLIVTLGAGDVRRAAEALCERRAASLTPATEWVQHAESVCSGSCRREVPLARHTSMAVGGPATLLCSPPEREPLRRLWQSLLRDQAPYFVLGSGTNTMFTDAGFEGVVVHLGPRFDDGGGGVRIVPQPDGTVEVSAPAGMRCATFASQMRDGGLSGVSFLIGIPGNLGGAAAMNAGTRNGWVSDALLWIEGINAEGEDLRLTREDLNPVYRWGGVPDGVIVTRVGFKLTQGKPEEISAAMLEETEYRRKTQPGGRNCGCVFKNPEGDHAGRLVDAAGLKGFEVGAARVSPVHANFVENRGGASASDVLEVMAHTWRTVREQFGVELEAEVRILGPDGRRIADVEEALAVSKAAAQGGLG